VIANYVTPRNGCRCDQAMRAFEVQALQGLEVAAVIERREAAPSLEDVAGLVPDFETMDGEICPQRV
jgi:hypothetical protein